MPHHPGLPEPIVITEPRWPAWVGQLVGPCTIAELGPPVPVSGAGVGEVTLRLGEGDHYLQVEARVPHADVMNAQALELHTREAYLAMASLVQGRRACHPVRFWNYLPRIHAPADSLRNRYMAFNAGRYEAFCQWFGGEGHFQQRMPTATGVGHDGCDLVCHLLCAAEPGTPVENPRQRPAYHYSPRYGPRPPCFARATLLPRNQGTSPLLLVGGTSSVVGEDSVHIGDVRRQTAETLENLAALVEAAHQAVGASTLHAVGAPRSSLAHFRSLRVYFARAEDRDVILGLLREEFESLDSLELFRTDLCREELSVEIAGVAEIASA